MPRTIVNTASAVWSGDLMHGKGTTTLDTSGAGTFDVAWKPRGEESGALTTPEELIASALATCFSMQFSHLLAESGTAPQQLSTDAEVSFVAGTGITGIQLNVVGTVEGITAEDFARIADEAARVCPVAQALAGVEITHTASLA